MSMTTYTFLLLMCNNFFWQLMYMIEFVLTTYVYNRAYFLWQLYIYNSKQCNFCSNFYLICIATYA